jgi:hypothetical protein
MECRIDKLQHWGFDHCGPPPCLPEFSGGRHPGIPDSLVDHLHSLFLVSFVLILCAERRPREQQGVRRRGYPRRTGSFLDKSLIMCEKLRGGGLCSSVCKPDTVFSSATGMRRRGNIGTSFETLVGGSSATQQDRYSGYINLVHHH